jgi:hypothetical protein
VGFVGAQMFIEEFEARAGSVDNPRQVKLLPAEAISLKEVLTVTRKIGLSTDDGQLNYVKLKKRFERYFKSTLVPTLLYIVGENRAYIYSEGQYLQLSSEINAIDGTVTISSPTGYLIQALDNTEINYIRMEDYAYGVGIVANKNELALKQGVTIKMERSSNAQYTPVYSKTTAHKLYFEGNGVLETSGVVFQFNEAIFNVSRHIDRAALAKMSHDFKMSELEIYLKIGFRCNLGQALDAANNLKQQDQGSPEGKINTVFASMMAYTAWMKFITNPIEGGLWAEVNYRQGKAHFERVVPMPSYYLGQNLTYNSEYIEFAGTRVRVGSLFMNADEVLLTSAFSSYAMEGLSFGGGLSYNFATGMPGGNVFYHEQSASGQHALYADLMINDEFVAQIKGKLTLDGAKVEADSLKLNLGQLLLKSVHNLNKSKNFGFSLGAGVDKELEARLSNIGFNYGNGERAWIDDIARLIGREKVEIIVAETIKIMGAVIANAERNADGSYTDKGKLYIKAAELLALELRGYDKGKLLGASASLISDESREKNEGGFGNEYTGQIGYKDFKQVVLATIPRGVLDIGEVKGDINRDINKLSLQDGFEVKPITAFWAESLSDKNLLERMFDAPRELLQSSPKEFVTGMFAKVIAEGKNVLEGVDNLVEGFRKLLGQEAIKDNEWIVESLAQAERLKQALLTEKLLEEGSPLLLMSEVLKGLGKHSKEAEKQAYERLAKGDGFVYEGYLAFSVITKNPEKPLYARFKIVGNAASGDVQPEGSMRAGDYYVEVTPGHFALLAAYQGLKLQHPNMKETDLGERVQKLMASAKVNVENIFVSIKPQVNTAGGNQEEEPFVRGAACTAEGPTVCGSNSYLPKFAQDILDKLRSRPPASYMDDVTATAKKVEKTYMNIVAAVAKDILHLVNEYPYVMTALSGTVQTLTAGVAGFANFMRAQAQGAAIGKLVEDEIALATEKLVSKGSAWLQAKNPELSDEEARDIAMCSIVISVELAEGTSAAKMMLKHYSKAPLRKPMDVQNERANIKNVDEFLENNYKIKPSAEAEMISKLFRPSEGFSLDAHEGGLHKGHTIERHVGKDRAYLESRNIPFSSTYPDKATAERVIERIVKERGEEIAAWKADPNKVRPESFSFTFNPRSGNLWGLPQRWIALY